MTLSAWLDDLDAAARDAEGAERAFRAQAAREAERLTQVRVFAYRRMNFLRDVAGAAASAEDEPMAVAHGLALFRARLGWSQGSEAREEIVERFAPVCAACFAALGDGAAPPPAAALAAFESWFTEARGGPFWSLFDAYSPETPVVDF